MSPSSSSLQALVAQFHNRYPMGSLTSELLTVHQGQYVVRALVQMGGVLLATGMAAAADVEQAEDRAKIRALEMLSLQALPASTPLAIAQSNLDMPQASPSQGQSLSDRLAAVGLSLDTSGGMSKLAQVSTSTAALTDPLPVAERLTDALPKPSTEPSTQVSPPISPPVTETVVADWYSHINVDDEDQGTLSTASSLNQDAQPSIFTATPVEPIGSLDIVEPPPKQSIESPAEPVTASPPNGKLRLKNDAKPTQAIPTPVQSSVDLSDVIAQTDVELARLGWTRTQGREHLKRTYGKRSRQELDEVELYDFLSYLEAQPAP